MSIIPVRLLTRQSVYSFTKLRVSRVQTRLFSQLSVQCRLLHLSSSRGYASTSKTKSKGGHALKQNKRDVRDASEDDARDKSMKGKSTSTSSLVPGSEQPLSGEDLKEYNVADSKMQLSVDWFRKECATYEGRGSGRVTPALLQSVRVEVPGGKDTVPLTDVAVVGVREGTTLVVTAMQDSHLSAIEKAIYAAKIPHIVPQKEDARTIKVPVPRPTVEARNELVKSASKQAEGTRIQLRRQEQTSVKKRKCEKGSIQLKQFHDLLQRHLKEVDTIVETLRKRLGGK